MGDLELLKSAIDEGIIDLDLSSIKAQLELKERTKYLEKHTNKIWQGSNGLWYTWLPVTADRPRKLIKKKNKDQLENTIIGFYKAIDPDNEPTFEDECLAWMEQKRQYKEVKESSLLRYEDDYVRFIKGSEFGKYKVKEIDDLVLDSFLRTTVIEKNLTSKAFACFRTIIIGTLKYSKAHHHTTFSVGTFFRDFQISNSVFKKPSEKRKIVYSASERKVLYTYLMDNPTIFNLALALLCLTGLRIGEIAALKYEDNISDCHLFIHRTETKKAEGKKRTVFVNDTAKMDHDGVILIPRAAQNIINRAHMMTHDDEYLFSYDHHRINVYSLRKHLKKACNNCGVSYKPPHQMRKTYGSLLLANGTDEAIVQRQMRHAAIATTRNYYQFVTESDAEEQAVIERIIGI